MTTMTETVPTPDFAAIKAKQNAAWASGDYAKIGTTLQIVGETLAEAMDLDPDSRVLDVAAGNGNATLAFARRWCDVTSTDYVDSLLAHSRARAEAEALEVTYQIADAENLPFADESFDAVVSTFGVMFTPNQAKAAAELMRVCRTRGKIGMANWTPESFVGDLFRTLGRHLPPAAGMKSPALWGTRVWLDDTFGAGAKDIKVVEKSFMFRYRTPDHFVTFFRDFYGPVHKAFQALDAVGQAALTFDLREAAMRHNMAKDGSLRAVSGYLEVIITRA